MHLIPNILHMYLSVYTDVVSVLLLVYLYGDSVVVVIVQSTVVIRCGCSIGPE